MKRKVFTLFAFVCLFVIGILFAGCGKVTYKLDFIVDNGVYYTLDTTGNETVQMPNNPTKEGFFFDGWYWDKDSWTKPFTANSLLNEPLSSDMKVYAKWNDENSLSGTQARFDGFTKIDESTYSIALSNSTEIFNFSNIVEVDNKSRWILCTDIFATQEIPSKTGTLSVGNNTYYVLVTAQTGNVRLYTLRLRRKPLYQVTFATNGGTNIPSQTIEEGSCATQPDDPTLSGYSFAGWNFDFTTPITNTTTISANYQANSYKIIYHSNNDKNETFTQDVSFNDYITLAGTQTFDYTAYDLIGWRRQTQSNTATTLERSQIYTDEYVGGIVGGIGGGVVNYPVGNGDYSVGESFRYSTPNDLNLYAIWQPISYTINYHLNSGKNGNNPSTYNIESETISLIQANKTGYTFNGWYTDSDFTNEIKQITTGNYGDLDLYAKYSPNTYIVSFDVGRSDVENIEPLSVTFDSSFTLPTLNDVDGYDFGGWLYNGSTFTPDVYKVANDITLTANWQAIFSFANGEINLFTTYGKDNYYEVNIPNKINNILVTSIREFAFSGSTNLTSITIPESVTSIGNYAFNGCSSLTSITIPKNVTRIGNYAFKDCSRLTSMTIPENVTSIGSSAFSGCRSLESMVLPFVGYSVDSPATFGYIFGVDSYIGGTKTVQTYDYSVTDGYSSYAYYIPTKLKSVVITGGTKLNQGAFSNCTNLTSIILPNSLTNIGESAFESCSSLTSLSIPNNVTVIGKYAFYNCRSLTSMTIPNGVNYINERTFSGCSNLISIIIPDNVTTIGNDAFKGCSSLTSVPIPENVRIINQNTFYGCSGLTSVNLSNIISIGEKAFYNCSNLTEITIPNSVKTIFNGAFGGCSSLEKITLPFTGKSRTATEKEAMFGYIFGTESYTGGIRISQHYKDEEYAFVDYYIPEKLKSVILTDETKIKFGSFSDFKNLTDIQFPENLATIEGYAFQSCYGLTEIEVPDCVTNIGYSAFRKCASLEKITLPFIGNSQDAINRKAVFGYIFGAWERYTGGVETDQFYDTFYIPATLKTVIITNTNVIGNYAFYNCSRLENIVIANSIETIGDDAFSQCLNLSQLTIESAEIYKQISSPNSCGNLLYYATTIKILKSIVNDESPNDYLNNENNFNKAEYEKYYIYTKIE